MASERFLLLWGVASWLLETASVAMISNPGARPARQTSGKSNALAQTGGCR